MKKLLAILAGTFFVSLTALAADSELSPKIAYSSKFRNLDYFFTENAEKQAIQDGSDYNTAIRQVGWDLISAVGRACISVSNIQAVYIDRINYKDRHSFVVRGVMADLKFQALKFDNSIPNQTLKELITALEKENIKIMHSSEANGVELKIAER